MPMTLTARPTMAMPVTMPKIAVISGRPAASSEPNAMSRMIRAAMKPTTSLENGGDVPAQLHLGAGHVRVGHDRPGLFSDVDQLVAVAVAQVDLGVGNRVVLADLVCAFLAVRAHHLAGRSDLGNLVEQRLHIPPDRRVVDVVGLEHDLPGGAGTGVEAVLLEQVDSLLTFGPRKVELVQELAAEGRVEREQADEQDNPGTQDAPATPVTEAGEALQNGGNLR